MTAIAGTVFSFRSMADGSIRIAVDFGEQESRQAMKLLCEVGAAVAIARLTDATAEPDDQGRTQDPSPDDDEASEGKALYGQQAKELRLSGFFLRPEVWKAIGRDAQFREWIQKQPSCLDGESDWITEIGEGRCEAAHVRRAGESGTGFKGSYACVPLTHGQHAVYQHQRGEVHALNTFRPMDLGPWIPLNAEAWFDEQRIKYVKDWCWQKLKADLGFDSWRDVPPNVLREWADDVGVVGYLPSCYRDL